MKQQNNTTYSLIITTVFYLVASGTLGSPSRKCFSGARLEWVTRRTGQLSAGRSGRFSRSGCESPRHWWAGHRREEFWEGSICRHRWGRLCRCVRTCQCQSRGLWTSTVGCRIWMRCSWGLELALPIHLAPGMRTWRCSLLVVWGVLWERCYPLAACLSIDFTIENK